MLHVMTGLGMSRPALPSLPAAYTVLYLPSMSSAQFWDHFAALSDEERTTLTPGGLFILDWEPLTMTLENLSHLERHEGSRLRAHKNAHSSGINGFNATSFLAGMTVLARLNNGRLSAFALTHKSCRVS